MKNILRWVATPFALILAQGIVRILWNYTAGPTWLSDQTIEDLIMNNTLSQDYFNGILFILARESTAVAASYYVAMHTAPSKQTSVIIAVSIFWILLWLLGFGALMFTLGAGYALPTGDWLVSIATMIATIGTVGYMLYKQKEIVNEFEAERLKNKK